MEEEFKIFGRTGKQCRERWHNQLNPTIKNTEWTLEEEKTLIEHHNNLGNKWAKISQYLEGRTDSCVKNHFYSILRKGLKRVNSFVSERRDKSCFK
jgi:myb proto-oncogene protein